MNPKVNLNKDAPSEYFELNSEFKSVLLKKINFTNKFMKYTIHGYSQEKSIENGLDYLDLGILRWIQDFYPAMKKTIFQNKEYGWFSYSYFLP